MAQNHRIGIIDFISTIAIPYRKVHIAELYRMLEIITIMEYTIINYSTKLITRYKI